MHRDTRLNDFLESLRNEDLAAATVRGMVTMCDSSDSGGLTGNPREEPGYTPSDRIDFAYNMLE